MSTMPVARPALRTFLIAGAGLSALLVGEAALAQRTPTVENRVDRLEQEMRAVQRKVFPGGAGQLITPDVTPTPTPGIAPGAPAESPIADLTARVSAIEAQVAQLTGQVEENQNKLRQLEAKIAQLSAPPPAAAPVLPADTPAPPPAGSGGGSRGAGAGSPAPAAPAAASAPGDQATRNQQVAAIERPSTGNAALDSYTYGYRLWAAHFYPEAQAQLQSTLDRYPNDPVASRTQNLLGRAFLDDGKPYTAVTTFYENYRKRPDGERAAESLAWTGEALIRVNDLTRACVVYDQINDQYGATMPANVRQMVTEGRTRAKCGG